MDSSLKTQLNSCFEWIRIDLYGKCDISLVSLQSSEINAKYIPDTLFSQSLFNGILGIL